MTEGALKKFSGIVVGGPLDGSYFESDSQLLMVPVGNAAAFGQAAFGQAAYSCKIFQVNDQDTGRVKKEFHIWSLNDKDHNIDYIMRQLIANYERKKAK